jgi:signal peptidase I
MRQKSIARLILEPLAVAVAVALLVRSFVRIYTIPSASMLPTLEAGDHILVTPYFGRSPRRGDVVVFRSPAGGEDLLVKRVVAAPGDLIDARLGQVRIGGRTLAEPYLADAAASGSFDAQVVAPDSYFVLGDNRGDSRDSRHWGPLPRALIAGKARMVLWSSGGRRVFKWIR